MNKHNNYDEYSDLGDEYGPYKGCATVPGLSFYCKRLEYEHIFQKRTSSL